MHLVDMYVATSSSSVIRLGRATSVPAAASRTPSWPARAPRGYRDPRRHPSKVHSAAASRRRLVAQRRVQSIARIALGGRRPGRSRCPLPRRELELYFRISLKYSGICVCRCHVPFHSAGARTVLHLREVAWVHACRGREGG